MQLPDHLEWALAENAATALARDLNVDHTWSQLLSTAQVVLNYCDDLAGTDGAKTRSMTDLLPCLASARIVDAALDAGGLGSQQALDLTSLATVAYGMAGNFPGAGIFARRLLDAHRANGMMVAVLASCAPGLVGDLLLANEQANDRVTAYLEALNAYHTTGEPAAADRTRELHGALLENPGPNDYEAVLLSWSRHALEHQLDLATARVLREVQGRFPDSYRQRLIDDGRRVLLPTQAEAVRRGLVTDSINAFVALPTSTGKTLIGELFIISSLTRGAIGVYVTPWIASGRQVAARLRSHTRRVARLVELFGRLPAPTDLSDPVPTIIVATPERLDSLMRLDPTLAARMAAVVLDEAHLIENGARGLRLEGIAARLRLQQARTGRPRLLLLSAVVEVDASVRNWLTLADRDVLTGDWAPTARRLGVWFQDGRLIYFNGGDPIAPAGTQSTTAIGVRSLVWPREGIYPTGEYVAVERLKKRVHENAAYLVSTLMRHEGGETTPILLVCATREDSRSVAHAVSARLARLQQDDVEMRGLGPNVRNAIALIEAQRSELRPLADMLRTRVSYHNAALPTAIRAAIEAAIDRRELDVVAATTTLAEGVDLPFRYTILVDWLTWQVGGRQPLSPRLFRNIVGRCGRAGLHTQGDAIVVDNPLGDLKYTDSSVRRDVQRDVFFAESPGVLTSTLAHQADDDSVQAAVEAQALAMLAENTDLEDAEGALAAQLLASQGDSAGASRLRLHRAFQEIVDPTMPLAVAASPLRLTEVGEAATRTALSARTARKLSRWAETADGQAGYVAVCAGLLREFAQAPEQPSSDFAKLASGRRTRVYVRSNDLETVVAGWFDQTPLVTMFVRLPKVQASSIRPPVHSWVVGEIGAEAWQSHYDRFVDFAEVLLGNFLPWMLWSSSQFAAAAGRDELSAQCLEWAAQAATAGERGEATTEEP